ncbi:unnamed protein product [Urochloa decumbens]|uniref:non-specific serine/threonine protein kinase n=1 Tax=Urochloa decumbens TaxID=240449 RepID=A0ABC9E9B9_9POAL
MSSPGTLSSSVLLATVLSLSSLVLALSLDRTPPNNDLQTLLCLKVHLSDSAGQLSSWRNDSLQFCSWAGVGCGKRNTSRVVALDLESFQLNGQIPPCIANLTFLTRIHFPNNQLSGSIPPELGQLNRLQYLNLSSNNLSGVIPDTLSSCSALQIIDLGGNSLLGVIPEGLGMLQNLSVLHLAGNSLTGTVPLSLGCKSSLTAVVLTNNSLTGPIPSCLANSSSLQVLDLTNNHLDGEIPFALLNSRSLQTIALGLNKFVGSIPALSHSNSLLQHLILTRNDLSGVIPSSLGNFSSLLRLLLAYNNLEGSIPESISKIPKLQALDLTYNYLSGTVPTSLYNMSTLTYLGIGANNLEGEIPHDIGFTLPNIRKMIFLENQFHGKIPASLANATNLTVIDLRYNSFRGIIPSLGSLPNLVELNLGTNQLEAGDWSFLSSLANCTQLVKLSLSENQIQGTLPSTIGDLANSLKVLLLSGNNISGKIPPEIGYLTNVTGQKSVHWKPPRYTRKSFKENDFSGPIPEAIGYCKNLEMLNLSCNSLDGRIPKMPLALSSLTKGMDLSHNQLSGQIPLEIGGLINLGLLNISNNQLSGQIPSTLGQCVHLESLHIEGNHLEGEIPKSFIELRGIMELDLSRNNLSGAIPEWFEDMSSFTHLNLSFNNLEGPVPTIGIFQNKSTVYIQGNKKLCGSTPLLKLPLCDAKASRENHTSKILKSEEHTVAIKVFKLDQLGTQKSFLAECEALRNTRHRNLVKVITACSTFDPSGHEFKALILEYMPNGSLESWLYPELNKYGLKRPLSLGSRITIAMDIASALDYLHNHCMPVVAHCDLKPSNVLLDDAMGARLADFGLAKFLHNFSHSCNNSSTSLLGPRGSIGYIAPEYGFGSKLSTEGDVYSYGIIILEMLTGKRPTDEMFTDGLNLHKFVEKAFPQKITEVLDPCIIPSSEDGHVFNNFDHGSNTTDSVESCIEHLVKLGLLCSMEIPKDRPTMQDVYAEVITIKEAFAALHG